jgi:hypothetical protein
VNSIILLAAWGFVAIVLFALSAWAFGTRARRMDLRIISNNLHRQGLGVWGWGVFLGASHFIGIVKSERLMRPVRMKHIRKAKAKSA